MASAEDNSLPSDKPVSVVVPAYNEEATLEATIERILKTCGKCTKEFEIIICDDCSSDRTAEISKALVEKHVEVRGVRNEKNLGIAGTMKRLYTLAEKDWVFLIPGDNEYPPEALEEIMPMLDEYQFVVCRRTIKPYGGYRSLVSGCYHALPKILFGIELYDPGSTKCGKREIYSDIPLISRGVFDEAERLIRAHYLGYRIGHVDIKQTSRDGGVATGARTSLVIQAVVDMLRVWFELMILRRGRKRT
ncbi:MAG: hypothetical protein CMO80_10645 [Verrucomicrobiales bacterium]|nr:hypothetical protein [Verrucomicrobiales bacterium]|tara:strand:- start:2719 stop:3462 length:744 start_codon:yes stop_codon:yes gene_type:complete